MAGLTHLRLRKAIIATCLEMNASGLNQGTSGNVSARVKGGMLITPSGIPYAEMTPQQIVAVDLSGEWSGPFKPSSEWRMHRDILANRPEAGAVVHVHSTAATALSCLRREIPPFHYMVAVAGGTTVRCADYALFGTQALSERMLAALEGRSACLLANHGQIVFGANLAKALWLAGEIEALASQFMMSSQLGSPVILDDDAMADVLEAFKDYGKQPAQPKAG